jgi:two-component sensor histidine kinase
LDYSAVTLGFIVSELIANATKYGRCRIAISLRQNPECGYALSVSNDGKALPEGFDPSASKGLGMRIIRSFTNQIGGELRFGRGDGGQGARFTVLFPGMAMDVHSRNAGPEEKTAMPASRRLF